MEGLARLVSESMSRHGMDFSLDYRRLPWSRWFRFETHYDLVWVPGRPGLFALAEELIAPGETAVGGGKRMLAVLQVSASDDLAIAMSRLFAPNHPLKDRVADGRIFARFTVIEDEAQRQSAQAVFQRWLTSSAETASGMSDSGNIAAFPSPTTETERSLAPATRVEATLATEPEAAPATVHPPAPLPSGF